jgi:hypothetical protein
VQVTAFFVQETLIGILYIYQTAKYFRTLEPLGNTRQNTRDNLRNLIGVNVVIIMLDCSVLGLSYSGLFNLQGFYKVAVYAAKLRMEFTILNQLRRALVGSSWTGGSGFAVRSDQRIELLAKVEKVGGRLDGNVY